MPVKKGTKMRTLLFVTATLMMSLLTSECAAQGLLYVSNLGQTSTGSAYIGRDSWIAQTLVTGTNPGGYSLNSVQLLMDASLRTPTGFAVSVYSKTGDPHSAQLPGDSPKSSLGSLSGPAPTGSGVFSYVASGIALSPSSVYFIVATASTPIADGAYAWRAVNGATYANGFSIEDYYFGSSNGSTWTWYPRQSVFQIAIYATPIPEPSASLLLMLGLGSGVLFRRRRRQLQHAGDGELPHTDSADAGKRTVIVVVILLSALWVNDCKAQGTLYVSNLGQPSTGAAAIASDSWIAQTFIPGTNAGGYRLDSVQLLMNSAPGNPSGFRVAIWGSSSSDWHLPGNYLASLAGPNPLVSGIYSYTASDLWLAPGTYFVVASATTAVAGGYYQWSHRQFDDTFGSQRWSIFGSYCSSTDGITWHISRESTYQMAIYATPIPEPSSSLLFMLGLGGVFFRQRRRQLQHAAGHSPRSFTMSRSRLRDYADIKYDSAIFIKTRSFPCQ